ncbi:hypothetical protein GGTG_04455 [Gaeumannomyces tritici R3-111a-1]|uniref:Uncharacterized protein n=1 Tax=Gaeumannomyces tritici (strain R3-111a-1) TaxID=644352 RepID=J3NT57_GAET3|nr:hypothetical protein GGTG_04455 [Gaeumannomyces tritici R3-111a-1]EJT79371.1 hypothetical protein GGTG_04455 [Gaeumannomyces tritici R3-111a-1]
MSAHKDVEQHLGAGEWEVVDGPVIPLAESNPFADSTPSFPTSPFADPPSQDSDSSDYDSDQFDLGDYDLEDPFANWDGGAATGEEPAHATSETSERPAAPYIPSSLQAIAKREKLPQRYVEWVLPRVIKCLACDAEVVTGGGGALWCLVVEETAPVKNLWAACPRCETPFHASWPQGPRGRLCLGGAHFPPRARPGVIELRFSARFDRSDPANPVMLPGPGGDGKVRVGSGKSAAGEVEDEEDLPDLMLSIDLSKIPAFRRTVDSRGEADLGLKLVLGYGDQPAEDDPRSGWNVTGTRFALDKGEFPGYLRSPASQ